MIQFFRSFFQSKIGVTLTLAFLGLIAFAFASSDLANTNTFGGVTGSDRVAVIGDRTISTADLTINTNSALRQARQENPGLTMEAFVEQGGMDDVLEQMISRSSIAEYGHVMGLRVSRALLDSEIRTIPGFQGLDGSFDMDAFRSVIRERGLTEAIVRDDLAMGLYARQLVLPVAYSATLPDSITRRYAEVSNETRVGKAATIPAALFLPEGPPEAAELQGYYDANQSRYRRPERRVLRYAAFNADAIGEIAPITADQIARRYDRDEAIYAPTQVRSFTQLVVPTQAAAQAIIDEVNGGTSLAASAQSKGLDTVTLTDVEQAELQSQTSAAVAQAAFDAASGDVVGPVRGDLGFYVLNVGAVRQVSGQSLAQASDSIRQQLSEERRNQALQELTEQLENDFADGSSLAETSAALELELQSTPELTGAGQVYETGAAVPEQLVPILDFAFQMEEDQPQLAEIVAGEQFLLFEVTDITPTAIAPLAEIEEQVTLQWRRDQGMAAAGQAARRVMERVNSGTSLADALSAEDVSLPAANALSLSRPELAEQGNLSRASILFFSMAQGTTKRVEVDSASTWFVIQLDEIQTANLADDDPAIALERQRLEATLGQEYVEQFLSGMQESLEAEANEDAVDALRAQLTNSAN